MMCTWLVMLAGLVVVCQADLFTAMTDLEEMFDAESVLIKSLEDHIVDEERRLENLKKLSKTYKREHDEAAEDVESYLQNPISNFLLVKRMTGDWQRMEAMTNSDFVSKIAALRETMKLPSKEDLSGAAMGLVRLQDTYNLEASSLSRGVILGEQLSRPMTADDCYVLAMEAMKADEKHHSVSWLREALRVHDDEDVKTKDRWDILDYFSYMSFKIGDVATALRLTEEMLLMTPKHEKIIKNKAYYLAEMERMTRPKRPSANEVYRALCRGEGVVKARLSCRYVDHDIAFLRIAPLKLEEASLSPPIHVYHDVLHDAEIATIKRLARPRFKRATVVKGGGSTSSKERTSKSAWLNDAEDRHVDVVNRRASHIAAGLTGATAEQLQVLNYGIGGHYAPHHDYLSRENVDGERIATLLFYMSDVQQGGATVFPRLGVALWPRKGSAALWYNLNEDGDVDDRTLHAGCPVLIGSKWVVNRWFHERGQEFIRPCIRK